METVPLHTRKGMEFNPQERVVALDQRRMAELGTVFRTDPSVQAAYGAIVRKLFSGGVVVEKAEFDVTDYVNEVLNTTWVKTTSLVIAGWMTWGFALVTFARGAKGLERTPVCLNPLDFYISFVYDVHGSRKVRILDALTAMPGEAITPRTDILFHEWFPVDSRGQFTSPVASVMPSSAVLNTMLLHQMRASNRLSAPPLVLETTGTTQHDEERNRGFMAMNDNRGPSLLFDREARELEQEITADQDLYIRALNETALRIPNVTAAPEPLTGAPRAGLERGAEAYLQPNITLPLHRKLVSQVQPTPPGDTLTQFYQFHEAAVAKAIGVPPAFWGDMTRSTIAAEVTALQVFHMTASQYRNMVQCMWKEWLWCAFFAENTAHMVTHYRKDMTHEENWNAAQIQVTLAGLLDIETLLVMREGGYMRGPKLMQYLARTEGLDEKNDFAPEIWDVDRDQPMRVTLKQQEAMELKLATMGAKAKANGKSGSSGGGGGAAKRKKTSTGGSSSTVRKSSTTATGSSAKAEKNRATRAKKIRTSAAIGAK